MTQLIKHPSQKLFLGLFQNSNNFKGDYNEVSNFKFIPSVCHVILRNRLTDRFADNILRYITVIALISLTKLTAKLTNLTVCSYAYTVWPKLLI